MSACIFMNHFSKKLLVNSITSAIFGVGCVQTIWANDTTTLPTITVNAEQEQSKKTFNNGRLSQSADLGALGNKEVIDTPFSFNQYTKAAMEDFQSATIGDVLKNDPSVRATTNSGHLNENFQIRGFSVNWEDMNLNGFYGVAPSGRTSTDILDSITVLKGPSALTTGMSPTGSVGGVVMAQTKRAGKDLTQVSATYEDGGYYKSGFDVSRRFGQDREFGVRASGSYGQGEHLIDGMDDQNASGVFALDYTTDRLKVNFDAYAVRDKRENGSPAMICFTCSNPSLGITGLGTVLKAPDGDSNYFKNLQGQESSQYAGLSAEYKIVPDFKVYGGVGYAEREYSGHLFGTRMMVGSITGTKGNGLTGSYAGTDHYALAQYYRVGSQEHNVAANLGFEGKFATGSIKHTLGLRADYLTRKFDQHYSPVTKYFVTNIYDTNVGSGVTMPSTYPVVGPYGDNKYVSYTLTDQLSMLDDRLQLILSGRYQDIDTKNLYKKTQYSSDKVSPSVGIVVKPFDANLSFYASYVEGLSEGVTVSALTYPTATNQGETFEPYQTKQYELGSKFQVGSWMNTLALYQIEKPEVYLDTVTKAVKDDAQTRSRGVELSTAGNITDDLSLLANLAYTDAEYTKSGTANKTGKTVYGVPDFTAGLSLDYKIPQVEGLSVNGRATYVSKQYLTSDNKYEIPDFTIVDLGAKYATKIGGVATTFRANVNNIADKNYWSGVFNDAYAIVGEGRTYKLGVTFDF